MRRLPLLAVATLVMAGAGPALAADVRTSVFYYPWYGTPAHDGVYQHWQQRGAQPPRGLASSFFPARGIYSSSDALVVAAQMREIREAGIDQLAVSWWGMGSTEDGRFDHVVGAARDAGLDVAVHIEPYDGRTAASTADDAVSLAVLGVRDVYVYRAEDLPAADWAAANAAVAGVRMFAHTHRVGFAAAGGFDGVYTYDVLVHGGWKFRRLCRQARRAGLLCAPSVGPGYHARRAVGDPRVKPRRNGRTYDSMWRAAIRARADLVTITSYNEWHEGTQIEPARAWRGPDGRRYAGYDGAWGRRGADAERAYLDRTAFWAARFDRQYSADASRRR